MKVICAGLSKTGTKSLAKALRVLGFTVYDNLEHKDFHLNEWIDLYCEGKMPDFGAMYRGVDAVIGLPAAFWYQEINEVFPDANVILSLRDNEEVWALSWSKQYKYETSHGGCGLLSRVVIDWLHQIFTKQSAYRLLQTFIFPFSIAAFGTLNSKSTIVAKKKYREHNERVQAVIPKEKLLIYNVKQGWKPLCKFLGCEVPEEEYPRENVGIVFIQRVVSARLQILKRNVFFSLAVFVLLSSVVYLVFLQYMSF